MIAREDKGYIRGAEYNYSPSVTFVTSRKQNDDGGLEDGVKERILLKGQSIDEIQRNSTRPQTDKSVNSNSALGEPLQTRNWFSWVVASALVLCSAFMVAAAWRFCRHAQGRREDSQDEATEQEL